MSPACRKLAANRGGHGPPEPRHKRWNVPEHLQFCLVALTIALFVITFIVQAFRIPSGSMEDTLLVGDYLLVDKTRFGPAGAWQPVLPYRAIRRGDIIIFHYPGDTSSTSSSASSDFLATAYVCATAAPISTGALWRNRMPFSSNMTSIRSR